MLYSGDKEILFMRRAFFWVGVFISSLAVAQAPVVPQGSVVSAASLLPFGAPGYQLAPGSIVSIFGTNLATSTAAAANFPLPNNLGGASVIIGGKAAPLFYASAGQINAQIPFEVATGAAVPVVVTTSAGSSSPSTTIPVVAAAPALFSANQNGLGNAAAQNFVSQTSTPANAFDVAIKQGGILIAYGTGGGSVGAAESTGLACTGGQFPGSFSATVAGLSATVNYAGCSPTFSGLDQWNIVIPSAVPDGCSLPLQVTVNGIASNAVTIAVSASGNCNTAATGQPQVGGGQSEGSLNIQRITAFLPGLGGFDLPMFAGSFFKNGAVAGTNTSGFPPANAGCLVQVMKNSSTTLPTGIATNTGTTALDAGTLTLKGSGGTYSITPSTPGTYGSPGGLPNFVAGAYSISGAGGKDVGTFGPTTLNLPALMNVSSPGFTGTTFSAAKDLTATLTCPDPKGEIIVSIGSQDANNIYGQAACSFACGSTITVPSSVLKQLPISAQGQGAFYVLFIPPNNNAGVTSANFSATGITAGYFFYTDIFAIQSVSLTP